MKRTALEDARHLERMLFEFSYWNAAQGTPFKPQSYALASEAVGALKGEVKETWRKGGANALEKLPGIGAHTALKIDEYFRTGHVKEYDALKKKYPVDIWGLAQIEGVGPKHIDTFWKKLKVKNISDLEVAIKKHKIRNLPGFGQKSEDKIAAGLGLMRRSSGRHPLHDILPTANLIVKRLRALKAVKRVSLAGSIRRKKPDVGDIDLVATSDKPMDVMEAFIHFPEVETVLEKGPTRTSVRLKIGIDCDLRVVRDEVYGAALQYFTGDRRHNIIIRELAIKKGYKLNEYGLFKKGKLVVAKTEKEIYDKLGLKMFPPEKRLGDKEFVSLKTSKGA